MTDLLNRWRAACRGAGATAADVDVDAAGNHLLGCWSAPHRHYHTVTHLTEVLDVVDTHAGLAVAPDRVRLAAWLHDAVYDPRALGDANERDSAEFAAGLLAALGVPTEVAADVARLVGLTAGHATGPDDPDGELLCDADLAILASDPARYADYTAAIRREYAHVPDADFAAARATILRALLDLPALYRHPPLAAAWERQARTNLNTELVTLTPPPG